MCTYAIYCTSSHQSTYNINIITIILQPNNKMMNVNNNENGKPKSKNETD
jgi:hypothetical protein